MHFQKFSIDTSERKFEVGNVKGVDVTGSGLLKSGNVAVMEIHGSHGKTKTTLSDRFYYILDGEGKFEIENENVDVKKNDIVAIPKNTTYDFHGKMKIILFSTPAFDPKFEVTFNK